MGNAGKVIYLVFECLRGYCSSSASDSFVLLRIAAMALRRGARAVAATQTSEARRISTWHGKCNMSNNVLRFTGRPALACWGDALRASRGQFSSFRLSTWSKGSTGTSSHPTDKAASSETSEILTREYQLQKRSIDARLNGNLASLVKMEGPITNKNSEKSYAADERSDAASNDGLSRDSLYRLAQLSRPEWKLVGLSAATLGITSSITLLLPFASGQVIDYVVMSAANNDGNALSPSILAGGLFGLSTVAGGGVYLRALWLARAGNRIVARLKQQLFDSILHQEQEFLDQQTSGDLLSRLTQDAQLVQSAMTNQAVATLRATVMTAGSTAMLVYTSPLLAAVSCCSLPPIFIITRQIGKRLSEEQQRVQEFQGIATTLAEEALSSVSTVKQFVAEQFESTRYRNAAAKAHHKALDTAHMQAQLEAGAHIAGNGAVLCVLGYGGNMVVQEVISAGDLTGFIMYSLLLAGNLSSLTSLYGDLVRASAAANRVFDILDRIPKIMSLPLSDLETSRRAMVESSNPLEQVRFSANIGAQQSSSTLPVSIELKAVNFRYPSRPENSVLEDFSLCVEPAEVVALVGGSGSGKSTVSSLITRLYDVDDENSVRIAGKPVSSYNLFDLRRMIGIVSQEPTIFRGTIKENIVYGQWGQVSDMEIMAAAQAAHVMEFAKDFPLGLDTLVGPRGSQLSGGQRQRIAIARVLLKNPPVVILDEATSSLDAKSEHVVQDAMDSVMSGRTVLSIAHRLSTIRHADRIAVVENGSIVQTGTFAELSSVDGPFRDLMKTQLVDSRNI